jgi:hypothetical protein
MASPQERGGPCGTDLGLAFLLSDSWPYHTYHRRCRNSFVSYHIHSFSIDRSIIDHQSSNDRPFFFIDRLIFNKINSSLKIMARASLRDRASLFSISLFRVRTLQKLHLVMLEPRSSLFTCLLFGWQLVQAQSMLMQSDSPFSYLFNKPVASDCHVSWLIICPFGWPSLFRHATSQSA